MKIAAALLIWLGIFFILVVMPVYMVIEFTVKG